MHPYSVDSLNDMVEGEGSNILFPTVVRFARPGSTWAIMNRADRGWAEQARIYQSAEQLCKTWNVRFVEEGEDEHGPFYSVEPSDWHPRSGG